MRLKAVALLSGLSLAAAANAAAVSPALVAKVSAAVDADAPRLTAIFNCGKAGSRWYRKRLKTTEINNLFKLSFPEHTGSFPRIPGTTHQEFTRLFAQI